MPSLSRKGKVKWELAFPFANWVIGYTCAVGATSIAVEDLSTLTAGGIGKVNNNRVAQSARRQAVKAITHLGARLGLEVIEVPARAPVPTARAAMRNSPAPAATTAPAADPAGWRGTGTRSPR
jgi:hypothetical protein